MRLLVTLLLLISSAWVSHAGALPSLAATKRIVVASWNVENLFDPYNDPANPGAVDFTPTGIEQWTPERYALKLSHLAEVIAAMQPDILCLAEIENRRVLADLTRVLREERHFDLPVILHREGGDHRGIDVAMLARWKPVATNWIAPVSGQRDILIARFVIGGRPLTVCANHWKSWLGDTNDDVTIRSIEARAMRREVEKRLSADARAAVIVAGDFNDNVESMVLTNVAAFVPYQPRTNGVPVMLGVLYNLSGLLPPEQRGTFYYSLEKHWNSFDSICVSRGMLPKISRPAPWRVAAEAGAYGVFALPQQCDRKGHPISFHLAHAKDGDVYITGYSDHLPVRVVLEPGP
jgi:endonuclease/exonuclease/phosphatase family metal-dependent hydrolase